MPTLDGLEILRRLQRDGIHVPVVLLSAFTQPEIVDRALAAGAVRYLSKEAPRDEILAALDAAAQTGAQPPLVPAKRALLQLLDDGWTVSELPALTGLGAGTIEQHLLLGEPAFFVEEVAAPGGVAMGPVLIDGRVVQDGDEIDHRDVRRRCGRRRESGRGAISRRAVHRDAALLDLQRMHPDQRQDVRL